LAQGKVSQQGSGADLLRHPRSEFVADFMGLNLIRASVESIQGPLVRVRHGDTALAAVARPGEDLAVGEDVFVVVDPREVMLSVTPATGSAQNVVTGSIVELAPQPPDGSLIRVTLDASPMLVAEVTHAAAEQLGLAAGRLVHASFKATGANAFR
jgi:ABC-type molybdate transport system ATPase subunit